MNLNYLIAVFASFFVLLGCGKSEKGMQGQNQAVPLPTVKAVTKSVTAYKNYPTSIEGVVNSQVRAKVSGYIQDVLVDEGELVKKGQRLFRLETQSLSQDAEAAQAAVNVAKIEVQKLEPLVEKGIISKVQLETAKAKLAQAKSSYQSVSANIGYATIKSPVDGIVGAINYRRGSLVSPSDPQPITTVSDIDKVYAYFSMNEKEYLDFLESTEGSSLNEKISNFPPVTLVMANGSEFPNKGKIEAVTGQINVNTGTVSFRAVFDNPNHLLTNGNSGTIKIPVAYDNVVVVPALSTFEQQGNKFVYQLSKDGKAISTKIEVKDEVKGLIVVASGIDSGDEIVAKGVSKIRNNAAIQPHLVPLDSVIAFDTVFK